MRQRVREWEGRRESVESVESGREAREGKEAGVKKKGFGGKDQLGRRDEVKVWKSWVSTCKLQAGSLGLDQSLNP